MAGKRQHFIPRFLLRGFSSHIEGAEAYTWVYRATGKPFNTNVRNVAVEGKFYSEAQDHSADEVITDAETSLAALVSAWRELGTGPVDATAAAQLVAHLEVRTRHLRETFAGTTVEFVERAFAPAKQPLWAEHIRHLLLRDPSVMRNAITREIARRGLPQAMAGPMYQWALTELPNLDVGPMVDDLMAKMRQVAPSIIPDGVKRGHLKALRAEVAPATRVAHYKRFSFRLQRFPPGALPLPDSIAVCERPDGLLSPLLADLRDLKSVALPLASDTLLVGGHTHYPADQLRRACARCSLEFFVASRRATELEQLTSEIGADASLFTETEMDELIATALSHRGDRP
jgi:hypothetical protein